jgi:hypothetical protein
MKWSVNLAAAAALAAMAATSALATEPAQNAARRAPQVHSVQSQNNSTPAVTAQAPNTAQQNTQRRSYSVQPTVKSPCGCQGWQPAPTATARQPQPGERRAMSIEPTPVVRTFNFSSPTRSRNVRGAPYLHADSKARGF